MKQTLKAMGEFGLIDWIRKNCECGPGIKKGIGDDTAVMPFSSQEDLLMTTDMFVENVHFTTRTDPYLVGRKALACNISDIAAMGGTPTFAVVSIGLPRSTSPAYVKKIYQGLNALAKTFKVYIVGGDTVQSEQVVIDVTLLGKVRKDRAILRSGAKPGDQIFVTGPLGQSLKSNRHLTFTPRWAEIQEILKVVTPTAMIDISDGFAADLGHILKESKVGAKIEARKIPRHDDAQLDNALYDGEDFEIVFTVPRHSVNKLKTLKKLSLYHIGEITAKKNKLVLIDEHQQQISLTANGFNHFS